MILEAKGLTFSYGKNNSRMLYDGFDFKTGSEERTGIMAPSGFGKTTLCRLLSGYEKPLGGTVTLDGRDINSFRGYCPVQMIWQHPESAVDPRFRMKDVLAEGDGANERIMKGLGIERAWLGRYPQELSGGELQRFCIARALGKGTRFIIADEISTMLDLITQSQIWNFLIKETQERKIGLVAVSHSEELLLKVCTRIIHLDR